MPCSPIGDTDYRLNNLMVIEIPVTLKKRVGESKGVGNNFFKAAATAIDMWKLIMFR